MSERRRRVLHAWCATCDAELLWTADRMFPCPRCFGQRPEVLVGNEKWILLSRRVLAVLIGLAVAIAPLFGYDLDQVLPLLEDGGEKLIALAAVGLALWSAIRPDGAKLKVLPKLPPPPAALWLLVLLGPGLPLLLGCAVQLVPPRIAFGQALTAKCEGYARKVDPDGTVVETCAHLEGARGGALSEVAGGLLAPVAAVGRGLAGMAVGTPPGP